MASGENEKKRPTTSPKAEPGLAGAPAEPTMRPLLDEESREDFIVRGSVVETPEGYKLRF